jgi:surfeit locus 1 family protein
MLMQTGPASEGLLREWPAVNLGVEKHYGYALQWFGIAAALALLYLWYQILKPHYLRTKDFKPHA